MRIPTLGRARFAARALPAVFPVMVFLASGHAAWAAAPAKPDTETEQDEDDIEAVYPGSTRRQDVSESSGRVEKELDDPRGSSVALKYSSGKDTHSFIADLEFGLGEVWAVVGSFTHTVASGSDSTTEIKAGGNARAGSRLTVDVQALFKKEADGVTVLGMDPSVELVISGAEAERETKLLIGGDFELYSIATGKARLKPRMSQLGATLGLTQELADDRLWGGLKGTKYFYSDSASTLSTALAQRPRLASAAEGLVAGFADFTLSLDLSWQPHERWSFTGTGSFTRTAFDTPANTLTPSVEANYLVTDDWKLTAEAAVSLTAGADASFVWTAGAEYLF